MHALRTGFGVPGLIPFLVILFAPVHADEIDHRPRQQNRAADPVEHEVFLHVGVGGDPAVIEEPEAEAEKTEGKKIGTDLGRLLFRHVFLPK